MIEKNRNFLNTFYLITVPLLLVTYYFFGQNSQKFLAENYFLSIPLYLAKETVVILFGVLLGLEHFLKERKKTGQWRLNIPRLLILALPCFVFFIIKLLAVLGITFNQPVLFNVLKLIFHIPELLEVFLGYILVTSFLKKVQTTISN